MRFTKSFNFEDVQLLSKKNIPKHKRVIDTSVQLGTHTFKIPAFPSNIRNEDLAIWLAKNNYFYILHHLNPAEGLEFIKKMHSINLYASISINIQEDDYQLIDQCAQQNILPEFITIDVMHADFHKMIAVIQHIKQKLSSSFIIAGNVYTPFEVLNLESAGADAIKIGIGHRKVCTTSGNYKLDIQKLPLSSINICSMAATKPIIADCVIQHNEDITKAIHFGAKAIMFNPLSVNYNRLLEEIPINREQSQLSSESASNQLKNNRFLLSYGEHIKDNLVAVEKHLQSTIHYLGGRCLQDIKNADIVYLNRQF